MVHYRERRKDDTQLFAGRRTSGVALALKPAVRLSEVDRGLRARVEYVPADGLIVDGEQEWNVDELSITEITGKT
jgi:hypothetical protein